MITTLIRHVYTTSMCEIAYIIMYKESDIAYLSVLQVCEHTVQITRSEIDTYNQDISTP